MTAPARQIQAALDAALAAEGLPDERRQEIAFHMTDWLADLEAWQQFCADPRGLAPEAVQELLTGFLVHVPNHLAAARRLYLGLPMEDVFGVGILEDDPE